MKLMGQVLNIIYLLSDTTDTKLFYNIFTNCWYDFSNFQIIINKHKCDVSGKPILELIRICHISQ